MAASQTGKGPRPAGRGVPQDGGTEEPDARDFLSISATNPDLPLFSINGLGLRAALRQRGPRRWLFGGVLSICIWGAASLPSLLALDPPARDGALLVATFAVFAVVYVWVPPLSWGKTVPVRLAWLALLFAITVPLVLTPDFGILGPWLWTFVAVACAMQGNVRRFTWTVLVALAALSIVAELGNSVPLAQSLSQPAVILSVGGMMATFSRQIETVRMLRQTQHELAELAVAEERNRVARDMHDILGHSLTVIAVKAELAGRLLEAGSGGGAAGGGAAGSAAVSAAVSAATARAAAEVGDIEGLARGALEDVRATVSGYRGVNVISELANARTALDAAGLVAELPGAADSVPARDRELFGWVLREGVTNVIRHAGATHCRVTMGANFLQVDDDGVGPAGVEGRSWATGAAGNGPAGTGRQVPARGPALQGNGLRGAAERAAASGAALELGRSDLGGFMLRVHT